MDESRKLWQLALGDSRATGARRFTRPRRRAPHLEASCDGPSSGRPRLDVEIAQKKLSLYDLQGITENTTLSE